MLLGETDTAYYVMDYVDGESLENLLKRRGSLPEDEALPIILKVADALSYLHKKGRFHLDVKPGNIMLRNDGKVILIDFGSSKQYAEVDGEDTSTLAPCYTSGYAPIEQMNPQKTKYTAATDIYALGATLHKMLTGQKPPSAISIQNGDEPLATLPEEITPSTHAAITAAMRLNREDRTQNIEEFVAAIVEGMEQSQEQEDNSPSLWWKKEDLRPVSIRPTDSLAYLWGGTLYGGCILLSASIWAYEDLLAYYTHGYGNPHYNPVLAIAIIIAANTIIVAIIAYLFRWAFFPNYMRRHRNELLDTDYIKTGEERYSIVVRGTQASHKYGVYDTLFERLVLPFSYDHLTWVTPQELLYAKENEESFSIDLKGNKYQ